MSPSTSLNSYPDIIKALEAALEARKGMRLTFDNEVARSLFCQRAHSFRSLDRKENKKVYEPEHAMYGRSAYDGIMVKKGPGFTVELVKLEGVEFKGEEIE